MKIAVRIDDVTPDMDWESFYRFKELLDRYEIKPLIGVVPDNQDKHLAFGKKREDFWVYMKELQNEGWSIALHGYQHVYTTKQGGIFPLNHFSEFAGVPYEKQKEMIAFGVKRFQEHGIHTNVFMAPGHSYDENTLRAVKEAGLKYVTDGFGKEPYFSQKYQLTFLPIAFQRKDIDKKKHTNSITTLVFHINGMKKREYEEYRKLFSKYRDSFISYAEYKEHAVVESTWFMRLKEVCMAHGKNLLVRIRSIWKR